MNIKDTDIKQFLIIGGQLLTQMEKKIITEIAMEILGYEGFSAIEPQIKEFINTEYNETMFTYAEMPIRQQINEMLDSIDLREYSFITKEILKKLKDIRLVDKDRIDRLIEKYHENLENSGD